MCHWVILLKKKDLGHTQRNHTLTSFKFIFARCVVLYDTIMSQWNDPVTSEIFFTNV